MSELKLILEPNVRKRLCGFPTTLDNLQCVFMCEIRRILHVRLKINFSSHAEK
mgnify:CR=1 FL=1